MERKNYSKPFLLTERFTPQEYCVICDRAYSLIYAPIPEDNGLEGWQDIASNVNGTHYDRDNSTPNNTWAKVIITEVIEINRDTYPHDNKFSYYEIHTVGVSTYINNPQTLNEITPVKPWITNQVFYRNYKPGDSERDYMNTRS